MPPRTRQTSHRTGPTCKGRHRFEHWYRDNQVYVITARSRDSIRAFASPSARDILWDRFDFCTQEAPFRLWGTSLLDNHYRVLGYCKIGNNLDPMMRKLHGAAAKLANDLLSQRQVLLLGQLRPSRLLQRLHPRRETMPGISLQPHPERPARYLCRSA